MKRAPIAFSSVQRSLMALPVSPRFFTRPQPLGRIGPPRGEGRLPDLSLAEHPRRQCWRVSYERKMSVPLAENHRPGEEDVRAALTRCQL
jgi:hypothetical protein